MLIQSNLLSISGMTAFILNLTNKYNYIDNNILTSASTMETQIQKTYILQDIMRKRRKNEQAINNKIKSKIGLKGKRKKNKDAIKGPQKFVKEYRHAQKSYAHYKLKNKQVAHLHITKKSQGVQGLNRLLLVVRVRGVKDISTQQRHILNRLNLRNVNTAVFVKGTPAIIKLLTRVENYLTWGQPSKKLVSQLIYKKLYGKIEGVRTQIRSNEQVEKHIGGDVLCLEDIINQVTTMGDQFKAITEFIYPFKLTTPEGTLASRLRKPVSDNGHWGYRGEDINEYVQLMV